MTKAELVEKMANDANVSKVAAGAVLDSFMTNVTKALKKKDGKGHAGRVRNIYEKASKSTQGPQSSNRRSN